MVRGALKIQFTLGWASLAITGVAVLAFGLIVIAMPAPSNTRFLQPIGAASTGMGLFGLLIAMKAYWRRERWAWFTLWY